MSGSTVSRALCQHFNRVRQAELTRLEKKLRGLAPADRRSVEAMTAEVIDAIARVPDRHIAADASPRTLEALVQLFALE